MLPLLIGAGVGGLMGMMKDKAAREAEANAMEANATQIKYSPWTGMKADIQAGGAHSPLMAGAEGAMSGAMFGSQFGGAGGMGAAAGAPAPTPWAGMGSSRRAQNFYG